MMTDSGDGIFVRSMPAQDSRNIQLETIKSLYGNEVPDRIVTRVRKGSPTLVLLNASKDAEMLVIGSLGLGGSAGLHLGSVSSACYERADCPVLIVKSGERKSEV